MKQLIYLCTLVALWGCNPNAISEADLPHLNGYWEITQVKFPDGTTKQYPINPSVDFIYLEEAGKGFRKKMQPRVDGTYGASQEVTSFTIHPAAHTFVLQYKNDFSSWEETLVRLDSTAFSVRNNEDVLYSYKRFNPITLPK